MKTNKEKITYFVLCIVFASVIAFGLGLKVAAVVLSGLFVFGLSWILPIEEAIFGLFIYLIIDGVFKLFSHYHHFVHVAQDVVLLTLLFRSFKSSRNSILRIERTPFFPLFLIYAIFIFLQFFNPFGLTLFNSSLFMALNPVKALLPSLASYKVYFSGITLFYLAYHHLNKENILKLLVLVVGLATFESIFATVEYLFFKDYVNVLAKLTHFSFLEYYTDKYSNHLYRPIGTTAIPAAPATWIYVNVPFATYLLFVEHKSMKFKLLPVLFFLFAIPTLIFCQTRMAIVLSVFSVFGVCLFPQRNMAKKIVVAIVFLVSVISLLGYISGVVLKQIQQQNAQFGFQEIGGETESLITADQFLQLNRRMSTLSDVQHYGSARGDVVEQWTRLISEIPLGIGLSRTGSSSGPWAEQFAQETTYGMRYMFTDNAIAALITEIGILGTLSWLVLVFSIIVYLIKKAISKNIPDDSRLLIWTCAIGPLSSLVGGFFVSEGVLYSPSSLFFWLSLSIGLSKIKKTVVNS